MKIEIWKPIRGYEGFYEVSDCGNVRSVITTSSRRTKILKPYVKNGYFAVNLFDNQKMKHCYIHRLVAEAFIENPDNKKEVNHIDCDKQNNRVSNLEWCNRTHNLQHSYDNGLKRMGENHGGHKLTEQEVLQIRKEYKKGDRNYSYHALGKKYNVNWCTIQAIISRRLWKHLKEGDVNNE